MNSLLQLKKLGYSYSMKLPDPKPKFTPNQKSHSLQTPSDAKSDLYTFPELPSSTQKVNVSTLKSRLSVLTDFGILPGRGIKISIRGNKKKIVEPKIKFFDLMGKRNAQKLFKILDLKSIIESAEAENIDEEAVKNVLIANKPNVFVQFTPTDNSKIKTRTFRSKNVMTANGPRNLLSRKKDIDQITKIMESCDQLKKESGQRSRRLQELNFN